MTEDWREETKLRLENSNLYKTLALKCEDDVSGRHVLTLVDDVSHYAYQRTKTILRHMGEYTLHDGDHLFRVLKLMENLLTPKNISKLSVPELLILILSAFFHDIGMAPDEKSVVSWKKVWDKYPDFEDELDEEEYLKFKRYVSAKPDRTAVINDLSNQGNNSKAELMKSYLISDYIRETHSFRAKEIIIRDWADKIRYRDTDLAGEVAEICFSHNENVHSVMDLDKQFLCGQGIYACLPLIAIILRLADILDFDAKRTPAVLFSHLAVRNPVSLQEWNKHRSIESWFISDEVIQFQAKCTHPAIEASIHQFCNLIDSELSSCNNLINKLNEYHRGNNRDLCIQIPFQVDRSKITTKKDIRGNPLYMYRDTQFNLSKNQVIDLLMGTKLYGDPEVALRELIQNSIDACLLRQALEKEWGNSYTPEITVGYKTEENEDILEVIDNGIGMDQYIIDSYYTKVGSSFYKSSDFYDMKSEFNASFTPTSRFGIGILSCFMVADTLIVDTRRVYGPHESSEPINLTVEGQESIFWIKSGKRTKPGTSTKLILRKKTNPWNRMDDKQFIEAVESAIPNPPCKIKICTATITKERDQNSFRTIDALSLGGTEWSEHDNINKIQFSVNDKSGIVGSIAVFILEKEGHPADQIKLKSKDVEIDFETYNLEKSYKLTENAIQMSSTTISITIGNEIEESFSSSSIVKSKSRFSLHGIEVPTTLFPDYWRTQRNQVQIKWPIPVLLVLDVCGSRDLDLNSSRTQVLLTDKWFQFEEDLAYIVCEAISEKVEENYWNILKDILLTNAKSQPFINGLNKVNR
ncbi:Molecular chaperone, HSP90 family [Paenibacillus uliginis N3/975]|uniref:Molecular chaperone, HSP90 family n=1 Tax=Paenibacillus uliginis N3/975 TaxID=1313296 RepID=A0A1X7HUS8_9BACL|nr:ATP-binding protein [Paenibacillus uliginis]SMF92273.1 Molecular chaperone, HSP90 family [Paenibacillus uliginis N3/975]